MRREIGRSTVIPFGKYKGKTGAHVAQSNPSYIRFIDQKLKAWTVTPDLMSLAVDVGMLMSEERADAFGTAGDWGFDEF